MIFTVVEHLLALDLLHLGHSTKKNFAVGDVAALGVAICLAISLTAARSASNSLNDPSSWYIISVDTIMHSFIINPFNLLYLDWIYILLRIVFAPIATCLIATGPRYITSAEVSLLLLLEAVLAPIFAWLILFEIPHSSTIYGGLIVLSVLIVSNIIALRQKR